MQRALQALSHKQNHRPQPLATRPHNRQVEDLQLTDGATATAPATMVLLQDFRGDTKTCTADASPTLYTATR